MGWGTICAVSESGVPRLVRSRHEGDQSYLHRLAHAHLPPEIADRWLALLRPAIRLQKAAAGELVLARLGGRPYLPEGVDWPVWEERGPMAYVGEIDLQAVAHSGLEFHGRLPDRGRLLFFHFDGWYGLQDTPENYLDANPFEGPGTDGARLLHVAEARQDCVERPAPEGVNEENLREQAGRQITTFPNRWEPRHGAEFSALGWEHPVNADPFDEALFQMTGPTHTQIGGWAHPERTPVEYAVAHRTFSDGRGIYLNPHTCEFDPDILAEADHWSLLLQVDLDPFTLYWLNRRGGQEPLDTVSFDYQCF